jgi:streptogramin lyase
MKSGRRFVLFAVAALIVGRADGGTMYVVSDALDAIFYYDANTMQPLPGKHSSGSGVFVGSDVLSNPHHLAVGSNGDIYVGSGSQYSDLRNGVYRFSKTTGDLVRVIGSTTVQYPFGIAFGPDHMLYVNSYKTNTIQRYDPDSGAYLGDFVTTFTPARSIVFGPDGNFYAATYAIQKFDGQTGALLGSFTSGHYIASAYSLTFGPDGDLYVFDQDNYEIDRFNGVTGEFKSVFVKRSYPFNPSLGIAFGPNGNLYTTQYVYGNTPINDGVDVYDGKTGQFLGPAVSAPYHGGYVSAGIAFDPPVGVPELDTMRLAALSVMSMWIGRRRLGRCWQRKGVRQA